MIEIRYVNSDDVPASLAAVPAGFPSPAADYVETRLDLNQLLIRRPTATFIVRVQGDSMTAAGIHSDDLLIVDRALDAGPNDIVVAVIEGDFSVKRLRKSKNRGIMLCSEGERADGITVGNGRDCAIWGVVTAAIRRFKG